MLMFPYSPQSSWFHSQYSLFLKSILNQELGPPYITQKMKVIRQFSWRVFLYYKSLFLSKVIMWCFEKFFYRKLIRPPLLIKRKKLNICVLLNNFSLTVSNFLKIEIESLWPLNSGDIIVRVITKQLKNLRPFGGNASLHFSRE